MIYSNLVVLGKRYSKQTQALCDALRSQSIAFRYIDLELSDDKDDYNSWLVVNKVRGLPVSIVGRQFVVGNYPLRVIELLSTHHQTRNDGDHGDDNRKND